MPSSGSAACGHATKGGKDTAHPGGLVLCLLPAACLLLSKPEQKASRSKGTRERMAWKSCSCALVVAFGDD